MKSLGGHSACKAQYNGTFDYASILKAFSGRVALGNRVIIRVRVAVQALRVSEDLLSWVAQEHRVLAQELAFAPIIVPCLQV
jgi:hypothetical protein